MNLLTEEFRKSDPQFSAVVVPSLDSGGGVKALLAGALDIALISRPLKGEEAAQGVVAIEYGKTPFVLATSKSGTTGLSLTQAADIYTGRQTAWSDGSPIRLVLRPLQNGDNSLLASFSPAMEEAVEAALSREGMIVAMTDQDAAKAIERTPGALGTSSLAVILSEKRSITPLAIEGVVPNAASIADGAYPHFKTLSLATKGPPAGVAARFVEFVRSPQGRRILAANGHWVDGPRPDDGDARN